MKTCFCFNDTADLRVFFFVLEGNYEELDGTYINSADGSEGKQDMLNDLVFNEDGSYKVERFVVPPKEYDYFIQCGFIQ